MCCLGEDDFKPQYQISIEDLQKDKVFWVCWILTVIGLLLFVFGAIQAKADQGTASYYTHNSTLKEGNTGIMANGNRMVDGDLTCASWFYKFGTVLKVTNLKTGKSIFVTVTDRGPSKRLVKRGRIIDLSAGAFKRLASLRKGIIKVEVKR
jgi:rare lipoprotein A (peptidoglycan hydrolase)